MSSVGWTMGRINSILQWTMGDGNKTPNGDHDASSLFFASGGHLALDHIKGNTNRDFFKMAPGGNGAGNHRRTRCMTKLSRELASIAGGAGRLVFGFRFRFGSVRWLITRASESESESAS